MPEKEFVGLEKGGHRRCEGLSAWRAGKRSSYRAFDHSKVFIFFLDSVCSEKLVQYLGK